MNRLARLYPTLTRPLTLANTTVLGRADPRHRDQPSTPTTCSDGKPVFLLMGAHHAREWPSAEHTMEFAFDLLQSYYDRDGDVRDRADRLLAESRVILVPGGQRRRLQDLARRRAARRLQHLRLRDEAQELLDLGEHPGASTSTGGTCADNPAGRLRGTDLNRNYPGFWGGGGASPTWSSDTFRGDGPGSEPESDAVRKLISERAVTVMISNHTYSNLVLRPPAIAATGLRPTSRS